MRDSLSPDDRRLAATLFAAFFTAQAAFIVMAPTLPDVAREFGVSIGTAGQLRTAAAVAGIVAALVMTFARRTGVRELLIAGLALILAGAALSAAAPGFAFLALAQVPLGAGVAAVLSAGVAAATEWPAPESRMKILALGMVGQPAAWVAGLPAVGLLSGSGWRWGWLVVPVAAVPALLAVRARAHVSTPFMDARQAARPWRIRDVRRWALGELLAYAAWGAALVYTGALLADSYDLGAGVVGLLLGAAAIGYFPGAYLVRRHLDGELRLALVRLALGLGVVSLALGSVRPAAWVTTLIFASMGMLSGARGIAGSAHGVHSAPEHKVAIGGMRAGATQAGYLVGAAGGGIAIDLGGWEAFGVFTGVLFGAAALPYLLRGRPRSATRAARRALAPVYARWPHVRVERVVPIRCRVVVLTRSRGVRNAHVWRLANGRPTGPEIFLDRNAAMRAAAGGPCG